MTTPSTTTATYRAMIERAEQHESLAGDWRRLAAMVVAPSAASIEQTRFGVAATIKTRPSVATVARSR